MEEYLDILNSDGTSAGYTATKKEAHEKGLWHRAAHVWFVNSKNEILLQKRADDIESHPGEYDISAAGHLTAGDTFMKGAIREIEEELGIKLEEKDLIKIGELHNESTQHEDKYINKEYNDIYVVKKDIIISDLIIQESEVSLVKYISIEEFKKWIDEKRSDLVSHPVEYKMLFDYLENNL
jgi:isopentenyldiphosphate isomerase